MQLPEQRTVARKPNELRPLDPDTPPELARMVRVLNEAVEIDLIAVQRLVETEMLCHEGLAEHPSIVIGSNEYEQNTLRLIGLLNGAVGALLEDVGEEAPWRICLCYADLLDGDEETFIGFGATRARQFVPEDGGV